ncbi:restriction endonuclease [Micromonospora wenchangensis]|uniref:restriction endonuclease n=1 Tax=Micromonospora wenchangensis TaxID=1185415 RepID=UPI0033FEE783
MSQPRPVPMLEIMRYGKAASRIDVDLDGYLNYHFMTSAPATPDAPRLMLEAGINSAAVVHTPDGPRRPVISLRSSPWKAGQVTNPWHDEFDLDHGHVRYFGDHKPTTVGLPGATAGNRALLDAWALHAATDQQGRLKAPPLLLYRSVTVVRDGRSLVKGHVEFCGAGIIERLEHVVQRDPVTGRSFPNIALDIAIVDLADAGDTLDMRWIDDRRNPDLNDERAARHAPASWRHWIKGGRAAIPRVRRRVLASRVRSTEDQLPPPGSAEATVLSRLYTFFDGRKHAFELLAAQACAQILGGSGARYHAGWLTRPGGDGGIDFVGRLDVGTVENNTPLVVLGQAKCIAPTSSIGPDQVARVVARLRRGWIGVFVTTGTFSRQAQVEVIDDQYPLVLVGGRTLVEQVVKMAAADHDGDLDALLASVTAGYDVAITYRRPDEILLG